MRILLTIGLIAPAFVTFSALRDDVDQRLATAGQELNGVEYLRVLGPLASALSAAQTAAVSGGSLAVDATNATLQQRIADVIATDGRIGASLGVHERWNNLHSQISSLARRGPPRDLYASYHAVMNLTLTLISRVGQLSGLSTDPDGDLFNLHRAVVDDLPQVIAATGRLADVAALNQLSTVNNADLAAVLELEREAGSAADRLVASLEDAATETSDGTLVNNLFVPLDSVRGDLDRLAAAGATITDGAVTGIDAEVISTLRENLATAANALSVSILDQLASLLTARRQAAERDGVIAYAALALIVVLALIPAIVGVRDLLRYQSAVKARERQENAESLGAGPQWSDERPDVRRERAGAAR